MILTAAIDMGNTTSKMAIYEGNTPLVVERGLSVTRLKKVLAHHQPSQLIICSVTKTNEQLLEIFSEFKEKIIFSVNTPIPIRNDYGTPQTLGYDRLAAAVGAATLFPNQNILLIDMGTAIKYDFVSADGAFKGGIISPGMKIRFRALHTFTKKLPLLEADGIPPLMGNTTKSCIQSGVVNGIVAELNGIIERYAENNNLRIIITGGDAPFFESQIKYPKFAIPNLVLEGLNRILQYNVEKN